MPWFALERRCQRRESAIVCLRRSFGATAFQEAAEEEAVSFLQGEQALQCYVRRCKRRKLEVEGSFPTSACSMLEMGLGRTKAVGCHLVQGIPCPEALSYTR